MRNREFRKKIFKHCVTRFAYRLDHFKHCANIFFDGKPAKDRHLLRQITDPQACPTVHGKLTDGLSIQQDPSVIRCNQSGDDVKTGRLTGTVRA